MLSKKFLILILSTLGLCYNSYAQSYRTNAIYNGSNVGINQKNIQTLVIPLNTTTHFISPEPIEYVDISTPAVQGDMAEDNVFRIRPVSDVIEDKERFTVTIVTKTFIIIYELIPVIDVNEYDAVHIVKVNPNEGVLLNQSDVLSKQQCFDLATMVLKKNRNVHNVNAHNQGMHLWLNGVYVYGNYILLDIEAKLKSKLQYGIDQMRFKIVDKKQLNATVNQDIEIFPYYTLNPIQTTVSKHYRNFFVFQKFTYPSAKLLNIEITEQQYSGRRIELNIEYNQILKALNLQ